MMLSLEILNELIKTRQEITNHSTIREIMTTVADQLDNPSPTDPQQTQGYQEGIIDALAIISRFVPLPIPTNRKRLSDAEIDERIRQLVNRN